MLLPTGQYVLVREFPDNIKIFLSSISATISDEIVLPLKVPSAIFLAAKSSASQMPKSLQRPLLFLFTFRAAVFSGFNPWLIDAMSARDRCIADMEVVSSIRNGVSLEDTKSTLVTVHVLP